MIKNIGIDIGNITTVASIKKRTEIIESRLQIATELNKLSGSITFENKGIEYLVGEGSFENNTFKFRKPSFINLLHYIIGNNVQKDTFVNMVIGIPVQQFTIEYKKELAEIIRANKLIDIKINGKPKKAAIKKFLIRPESYGVFKKFESEKKIVKGIPTLVCDIGGGTTDLSLYDENGRFVTGTSVPTGLLDYYNEVKEAIFIETGNQFTVEQAKEYTRGNYILMGMNNSIHLKKRDNMFNKIDNAIRAIYKDFENYNFICCGGGAGEIGEIFKSKISHTLIDTSVSTNAEAFYQICKQEFGENEQQ